MNQLKNQIPMTSCDLSKISLEFIQSRINNNGIKRYKPVLKDLIPAAVLLPLFQVNDEWHMLFTRRSEMVEDHKGQVAFPGGAQEELDKDLVETALREAQEEIGLHPDNVSIIGKMKSMPTVSRYLLTPIVGYIKRWPIRLELSNHEVASVFSIPVEWLANKTNYLTKPYFSPNGKKHAVYYYQPYKGEVVWGITAKITRDFLEMILGK